MSFHVGQKVVCVDDSLPANRWHRAHPLIKGQVYVVHHLFVKCIDIDGSRRGWQNWRFRPIVEKKSSTEAGMAILNKILDGVTRKRERELVDRMAGVEDLNSVSDDRTST